MERSLDSRVSQCDCNRAFHTGKSNDLDAARAIEEIENVMDIAVSHDQIEWILRSRRSRQVIGICSGQPNIGTWQVVISGLSLYAFAWWFHASKLPASV